MCTRQPGLAHFARPTGGAICAVALLAAAASGQVATPTNEAAAAGYSTPVGLAAAAAAKGAWRDPFWPVGYVPVALRPAPKPPVTTTTTRSVRQVEPVAAPVVDWDSAQKMLIYNGYGSSDRDAWCLINGLTVKAGETISIIWRGLRYKWLVKSVSRDGPTYERVSCGNPLDNS